MELGPEHIGMEFRRGLDGRTARLIELRDGHAFLVSSDWGTFAVSRKVFDGAWEPAPQPTAGIDYRALLGKYLAYRSARDGYVYLGDHDRDGMLEFPERFPVGFTDAEWAELQRLAEEAK
jgi:hypothetical protein